MFRKTNSNIFEFWHGKNGLRNFIFLTVYFPIELWLLGQSALKLCLFCALENGGMWWQMIIFTKGSKIIKVFTSPSAKLQFCQSASIVKGEKSMRWGVLNPGSFVIIGLTHWKSRPTVQMDFSKLSAAIPNLIIVCARRDSIPQTAKLDDHHLI